MRVAFLPVYPNPYQHLLGKALESLDVTVELVERLPAARWLHESRRAITILHLHWLDGLYMARYETPIRVVQFVRWFRLARRLGYRLVWTAHNVLPHRSGLNALHSMIQRMVMTEANAVIVHCEAGRRELLRRFSPRCPLHVIPLGHYREVFPVTMDRAAARQVLGIGESRYVYLALGNIASYKGLDRFVEAFRNVAGDNDMALIAGRNRDRRLAGRLELAARQDGRIRVHAGFIPDDAMQCYLLAADVMVAPFERILTSSSVMTGLSYGLPAIVPDLGCLPELVTSDAGLVYGSGNRGALERALLEIKEHDPATMRESARSVADRYDWAGIGRQTAGVYKACLSA